MDRHALGLCIFAALLVVSAGKERRKEADVDEDHNEEKDKPHPEDKPHLEEKPHPEDKPHLEEKPHPEDKPHPEEKPHPEDKPHPEEKPHPEDKPHPVDDHKNHDKDKDTDLEEVEDRPYKKWKHHYVSKYRRPLDLHIRVPFFTLFFKRDHTGPSKLGVKVFPEHHVHHDHDHHDHDYHGSLVDIHHRWGWKK